MADKSPAQVFALVFGIVYLIVGIIGFAVTGFDDFAGQTFDEELLVFPLNPLHNIVHLVLGGVWAAASGTHSGAKLVNMILGVVLLVVFALGMIGVLKFLAVEGAASADNYLHLGSGILALYFGSLGAETMSSASA